MKIFCSVMGMDCTNGGVTHGREHVQLDMVSTTFRAEEGDKPDDLVLTIDWETPMATAPGYLVIAEPFFAKHFTGEKRHAICRVMAHQRGKPPGMFGGHFIYTSDSRFPFTTPIPVFDRYE